MTVDAFLEAVAHGDTERALEIRRANPNLMDGVAEFGRDEAIAPDGDYEACIRALTTAG